MKEEYDIGEHEAVWRGIGLDRLQERYCLDTVRPLEAS